MYVCSSHAEAAIGPKRIVPAATRKKSHLYCGPPTTSGCKHPFATVWRSAGLSLSQPSLRASLLPRNYFCTRCASEIIMGLIQTLMKSREKEKKPQQNSSFWLGTDWQERPRVWLSPVHHELIPGYLAAFQNSPSSLQQAYFDGHSPKAG